MPGAVLHASAQTLGAESQAQARVLRALRRESGGDSSREAGDMAAGRDNAAQICSMMDGANRAGCLHGCMPAGSCGHDEDVPALPLRDARALQLLLPMRRICGRYCSPQTGALSRSRSAATAAGTGHPLWVLDTHCALDRFWPVVFLPYESLATGPVYYGRDTGTRCRGPRHGVHHRDVASPRHRPWTDNGWSTLREIPAQ